MIYSIKYNVRSIFSPILSLVIFLLCGMPIYAASKDAKIKYGNVYIEGHVDKAFMQRNDSVAISYGKSIVFIALEDNVESRGAFGVKADGSFQVEVPIIEPNVSILGVMGNKISGNATVVILNVGDTVHLEATMKNDKLELDCKGASLQFSIEEYATAMEYYGLHTKDFKSDLKNEIEYRDFCLQKLNVIRTDAKKLSLSPEAFNFLEAQLNMYVLAKLSEINNPIDPDYYSFLSKLDLNNPYNRSTQYFFTDMFRLLLGNPILALPLIENQSVDEWVNVAKSNLKKYAGTDKGDFYEVLAAFAYYHYLHNYIPFTDVQIDQIRSYWGGKGSHSLGEFLLEQNERVKEELLKNKVVNICKLPDVPKEKVMDAIVEKYKGKVIVVDFWGTWCGPCLAAIEEMRSLKEELSGKDVAFVYITDNRSSKTDWKRHIKVMSGDHYYVEDDSVFNSIDQQVTINCFPTYLIYDRTGKRSFKSDGFKGIEVMKEEIKKCL